MGCGRGAAEGGAATWGSLCHHCLQCTVRCVCGGGGAGRSEGQKERGQAEGPRPGVTSAVIACSAQSGRCTNKAIQLYATAVVRAAADAPVPCPVSRPFSFLLSPLPLSSFTPFLALTPSLPHSLSLSPGEGVPELQDALRRALSTAAASRGGAAGGGAAAAAGAGGGSGTGSGAGKSGPKGVASAASAAAGPTPVAAGAGGVLEDDGPPEVSVGSVNSCCICRRGGRSSGGWCGG